MRMSTRKLNVGSWAEDFFLAWLEVHNWQILAYNWRCQIEGAGQVDVIAKKQHVALFEVKYRSCQSDLNWPLSKKQILRLYRASTVWNEKQPQLKINKHYLVLIRPLMTDDDFSRAKTSKLNCALPSIATVTQSHLLQFFKFSDILD